MSVLNSILDIRKRLQSLFWLHNQKKNVQIEGHQKLVKRKNFQFIVNKVKETLAQKILQTPRSIIHPDKPMQPVRTPEFLTKVLCWK